MINGDQGETVTVRERSSQDVEPGSEAVSNLEAAPTASNAVESDSSESSSGQTSSTQASEVAAGAGEVEAAETTGRSGRGSVRDLEEEGEVAADYLEELLDIIDVDGDIDIDVENGRASLAIVAEGSDRSLRRLVGSNGEVLEALQELTRLAVQASTGERSRLMLDVAGHRAHRRKVLSDAAAKAVEQVKGSGKPLSLDPMSAFERKIVHDVVADAGLNSESEGVDPLRHVVILPASA
jgi:spoIIIJ-associated protein